MIEVVDAKGRSLIQLAPFCGTGAIAILRPDGEPLVAISLDPDKHVGGGGLVSVFGPTGRVAASLSGRRQGGQVAVHDVHGYGLGRLAAFDVADVGGAMLQLKGRDTGIRMRNGKVDTFPTWQNFRGARQGAGKPERRQGRKMGFARRLEAFMF
jgi:hypothetical protein